MKKIVSILIVAVSLLASSVYAEGSFIGLGVGLHFDLGSLANTITKDGLDSTVGQPNMTGASGGFGCNPAIQAYNANSYAGAGAVLSCQGEKQGTKQALIMAENKLLGMEKALPGFYSANATGPMTGIVLDAFWEREGVNTFWRIGASYTQKIKGGHTDAAMLGIKWYDVDWNYKSLVVPFYFGLKAGVGESGSVYAGIGVNYAMGGWSVGGNNFGDFPTTVLGGLFGPVGSNTVKVSAPDGVSGTRVFDRGGPLIGEAINFKVRGYGFNAIIGVEKKLESGSKLFIEIEDIFGGGYGVVQSKTQAASQGLAPFPVYPISLGGTRYKFGYKISM